MASETEMLIRNSVTPTLTQDLISSAEIEAKIRFYTTWASRVYFEGQSLPSNATDAIALLVLSSILARSDLVEKYGTLRSLTYKDFSWEASAPMSRGTEYQSDPYAILKTMHQIAIEILKDLSASYKYKIRLANE